MAEWCDIAEVCLRARMETGDLLTLLAAQAQADDYEIPAERLSGELEDLATAPGGTGGPTPDRMALIAAAAAETGGEVG